MRTKLFEIRDAATFIPAMAIEVSALDGYLMRRAGFGPIPMIYLVMLATQQCSYDPYRWSGGRTMKVAHEYIRDNFDVLRNGSIVDVEYILGERTEPKQSEQSTDPFGDVI